MKSTYSRYENVHKYRVALAEIPFPLPLPLLCYRMHYRALAKATKESSPFFSQINFDMVKELLRML